MKTVCLGSMVLILAISSILQIESVYAGIADYADDVARKLKEGKSKQRAQNIEDHKKSADKHERRMENFNSDSNQYKYHFNKRKYHLNMILPYKNPAKNKQNRDNAKQHRITALEARVNTLREKKENTKIPFYGRFLNHKIKKKQKKLDFLQGLNKH